MGNSLIKLKYEWKKKSIFGWKLCDIKLKFNWHWQIEMNRFIWRKFTISKWRRRKKVKLFLFELVGKSIWHKLHDLCVLNEFTSMFKWRSLFGVMNIRGKTYLCWFGASLVIGDRAGYPAVRGLPVIKYSERKSKEKKNETVDKFSISTQDEWELKQLLMVAKLIQ